LAVADPLLRPFPLAATTRVLDNGLRVVVHEDRSTPLVAVHLMLHVGSRNESPGRTGLAHLLEHLLYEGTERCAKGEADRLLESVGGSGNGSTWFDRTNYYETVPSHAVELALWLQRERLAHFLPVLDERMLELQRGVVINERLQAYENRPYGLADERLFQLLFPAAHPYSWPTIGSLADLEAMRLTEVSDFYRAFYTPQNAVVVVAGDIAADEALRLAERYFGDLPAGPDPGALVVHTGGGNGNALAREAMEDDVSFPRLYRAHAAAPWGSPEWTALDVLAYLLADGESSRLQRSLVRERQLVQDVDAYLYPTELAGVFGVVATARSGVDAETVAGAVDDVLRGVAAGTVDEAEIAGAVRRARRDQLDDLALVEERAELLACAATALGDADALADVLAGYSSVTPDDVQRAAERFLLRGGAEVTVIPGEEADGE
jgi:zinc protease